MRDGEGPMAAGATTSWFRRCRRWGGLGIAVATAAVGLAACGGGPSSSAHVARLGTSTTTGVRAGGSATASPKGKPTQLMNEWATCIRGHGDPGQTDPTIDQYGVIHADIPESVPMTFAVKVHAGAGPCSKYVLAAETKLRAAYPPAHPVRAGAHPGHLGPRHARPGWTRLR